MPVERSELVACCKSNDLLAGLEGDSAAIDFLAARCERRSYTRGAVMVREGEEGETLIVLVSGSVRVTKKTPAGEDYTVAILHHENSPCFGELSLLDAETRSASATAIEDAVVLTLTRVGFEEFADAFPAVANIVYRRLGIIVARHVREANRDMVTLFQALLQEIETQSIGGGRRDSG